MQGAMAVSNGAATEFRLLGPVEVVREGKLLPLGGRRQRTLLALLLLEPGRVVSTDRLTEELWHGDPPAGSAKTLRAYVSRLRSVLGTDTLVARSPGYVLAVEPAGLDVYRFDQLVREGRAALARDAAGLAADRLDAALALWRGRALADVGDSGVLTLEAQRLEGLRLMCLEDWIEAELILGRHAELVPRLEHLVAAEPLRERLWRQLVLALYRCERQADALAAYQRARALFAEELGLDPSEDLQELERAVLRHEIPQAAPADVRHNLPAQVTSFVGREQEVAELEVLLREHRIVTLTGAGGAGKTRLALEEASHQLGIWPGGVWLVDLTAVADPALVPTAVGVALGIAERPDVPALDGLLDHLRRAELLLILDNCEHLSEACGELVHEVLRACSEVRVLATSRVVLGIPGELDYSVEPLPTPTEAVPAEDVERFASVRLFLDRGRAARRDLAVGGKDLATVARICRELDGLPLAIELAAARAKVLSVDEIAARLDDRFRFLRSWRRIVNPRQQTLRATMDWSYELLAADERTLLARVSVFSGGFSLEGVGAVCLDGEEGRALELVGRLVETSLVIAETREGVTRYRLLGTIREYATQKLEGSGAAEELRRAHAEHFLEVARCQRVDDEHDTARRKQQALGIIDSERDNLHAALQWALARKAELALPLAIDLFRYWLIRGYRRQGLDWLEQALAVPQPAAPPVRAMALAGAALLARLAGDFVRARPLAEESIAVARAVGPPAALAISLNVLTTLEAGAGDYSRARAYCDESVAVARKAGSRWLEAIALFILAEAALHGGRYSVVRDVGGRALELARAIDEHEVMALCLARLGMGAVHEGQLAEARSQLSEGLEYVRSLGFVETGAWCCEGLALVTVRSGDSARGARLLGAAEVLRRASGGVLQPAEALARNKTFAAIRHTLAEEELEAALEVGRRMSLDEAVADAHGVAAPALP